MLVLTFVKKPQNVQKNLFCAMVLNHIISVGVLFLKYENTG